MDAPLPLPELPTELPLVQVVLSTNHLINTVRLLAAEQLPPPPPGPQEGAADVLVGEAYYLAKEQLLLAEQYVLRLSDFQLVMDHPHKCERPGRALAGGCGGCSPGCC